jgi:pilus assembly protein CpaB
MFAVSVAMRVPAQVAGFVQPGSSVAVFDTFTVAEGKGAGSHVPAGDGLTAGHDVNQATRLLLPKVEVLAIGGRGTPGAEVGPQPAASAAAGGGSAGKADGQQTESATVLVTVAVTQDQAQRLVHAAQTGNVYLALLGTGAEAKPGPGADNYTLFQ